MDLDKDGKIGVAEFYNAKGGNDLVVGQENPSSGGSGHALVEMGMDIRVVTTRFNNASFYKINENIKLNGTLADKAGTKATLQQLKSILQVKGMTVVPLKLKEPIKMAIL